MKSTDYARTYSSMSDGELARLVSEGRDSLTDQAAQALGNELRARGLNDDLLAREYPTATAVTSGQDTRPQFRGRRALIKDLRKLRPWQILVMVLAFGSTVTFTVLRLREAKEDDLYRKVVMNWGSAESRSAFNELLTYRGAHARQLIMKFATDKVGLFDALPMQTEAIRVLGETGDSEIADRLVLLIRPYRGVSVRLAAANSLLKLPCSEDCIRYVLDYKERMWRGDMSEETILGIEIPNGIREQKSELDQKLDQVLLRNRRVVMKRLIDTYGLGEIEVAPFALQVIRELKLVEACQFLNVDKSFSPIANEETLFPRLAESRVQIKATKQQVCQGLPLIGP